MRKISDIKLNIPKYPKYIIDTLKAAGYDAYIVGGCVRDELLGVTPSDFDITTNAKPNIIKVLFKKTIDTGIKHGTVSVLFYENNIPLTYEVTTYRVDGEYEDARHPKDVKFVENLKEDLQRRDFTVNAMAYNYDAGLVDEFGGLADLEKKVIRAVGMPEERFAEDALRLLRAIRFAAKLSFNIEEMTLSAIPKFAANLRNVSKERIQVELTKILTSDNPDYVSLIFDLGLSNYITTNFNKILPGKFDKKLKIHLAYACLFYNCSQLIAGQTLKELKFDNQNTSKILSLLEAKRYYNSIYALYIKEDYQGIQIKLKEMINFLGYELSYDFMRLLYLNEPHCDLFDHLIELINDYNSKKIPIFIQDLAVDGNDMIDIGFRSAEVGISLNSLLKIVHKNSKKNEKSVLKEIAKKAYNIYKEVPYEL